MVTARSYGHDTRIASSLALIDHDTDFQRTCHFCQDHKQGLRTTLQPAMMSTCSDQGSPQPPRKPRPKVLLQKRTNKEPGDGIASTSGSRSSNNEEPANLVEETVEHPTSRFQLNGRTATDVSTQLDQLEDFRSSTSLLLEKHLSDFLEVQRRVSALEEHLGMLGQTTGTGESGQTNFGDILSNVLDSARTAVDEEHGTDEMSHQRPGDEIPHDDRAQKSQIQELPEPDEFSLDGTVWGAAAVVGLPGLRIFDNLSIATGLAFNVFVQVLFCVIAYQSFSDERFPTVEDVKRWRYTVAHDVTTSDSTGVSLADRVCSQDASLVVSASQAILVEEIMQYVSVVDFVLFSAEQGSLLCCVAILIWLLVIMAEWHAAVSVMTAIWLSLDSATQEKSMVSFKNGASLKMPVSWYRFFAMLVIVGIRIGIAVALFAVGVQWLLATTSVENIILNAAALGFVMDLDELVYVTMLTAPVKSLLRRIEIHESQFRSGRCFAGRAAFVACFPCFAWLCVAALVAFIVPEVRMNVNTMQELDHYLCGGNRHFVFTSMPSTGIVMIKESEVFEPTLVGSYEVKSLEEAVWKQDLRNLSLPWLAPSDSWFAQAESLTVSTFR